MGTKVGALIKEARTAAKLSQTKLADMIGVSASDIGKAEKGEKELTQAALKKIATATGVTQKSLLDAAKAEAEAEAAAKKTTAATKKTAATTKKTAAETTKKTAATTKKTTAATTKKTTAATKKTAATSKKTTAATTKKTTAAKVELTAAEKKLVELYRAADSDTKKSALSVLKGESTGIASTLFSRLADSGLLKGFLGQ